MYEEEGEGPSLPCGVSDIFSKLVCSGTLGTGIPWRGWSIEAYIMVSWWLTLCGAGEFIVFLLLVGLLTEGV